MKKNKVILDDKTWPYQFEDVDLKHILDRDSNFVRAIDWLSNRFIRILHNVVSILKKK